MEILCTWLGSFCGVCSRLSHRRNLALITLVVMAGVAGCRGSEPEDLQTADLQSALIKSTSKYTAPNGKAQDLLGSSVAVEGDTAVIGARKNLGGAAYILTRTGFQWGMSKKITASDSAASDDFGWATAVSGDTAIIGASGEDDRGADSGSAYIFTRNGTGWIEQAKLTASDGAAKHTFGWAAALSGDTAIIGASGEDQRGAGAGAAYIFTRTGTTWTEQAKLTATDAAAGDSFGNAVDMAGDTAVIGAYQSEDQLADSGSAYVFTRTGTTWAQQRKLTASDGVAQAWLGASVSLDAGAVLVGASGDDDLGAGSGSAYLFSRSGTSWSQSGKLTAPDGAPGSGFGGAVSLLNGMATVGASQHGAKATKIGSAYLFARSGTSWSLLHKLTSANATAGDSVGEAVALAPGLAFVGAPGDDDRGQDAGAAYIFRFCQKTTVGGLIEGKLLIPGDNALGDQLGIGVAVDGDTALVGAAGDDDQAYNAGSTYVYSRNGTSWQLKTKLTATGGPASGAFGSYATLDGNAALIGAHKDTSSRGAAYIFTRSGTIWSQQARLTAKDRANVDEFGATGALDDDVALIGAHNDNDAGFRSGSAYVFTRSGTVWTESLKLTASDGAAYGRFGASVAMSGSTALVGASGDTNSGGAGYIFMRNGSVWTETQKLTASDRTNLDYFGKWVALDGDTAAFGAEGDDDKGSDSGSVYIFTRSGTSWSQLTKLKATDGAKGDHFGCSVALSGGNLLVGAYEDDDTGWDSGASYYFTRSGTNWKQSAKLTAWGSGTFNYAKIGFAVALSGSTAVFGGYARDGVGNDSGSAFLYQPQVSCLKEQAESCSSDAQCASGFCVDSVCCDSACGGWYTPNNCESCSKAAGASANGHCGPVPAGSSCLTGALTGSCQGTTCVPIPDSGTPDMTIPDMVVLDQLAPDLQTPDQAIPDLHVPDSALPDITVVLPDQATPDLPSPDLLKPDWAVVDASPPADQMPPDKGAPDSTLVDSAPPPDKSAPADTGSPPVTGPKLMADDGAEDDYLGQAVAFSGDTAVLGAPKHDTAGLEDAGAAYVFVRSGTGWQQQAKLTAKVPLKSVRFGLAVAVSKDTAVVGSFGKADSTAHIFVRSGTSWSRQQKLDINVYGFGAAVALDKDTAVIGSDREVYPGMNLVNSGAAYVYTRAGTVWTKQARLAPDKPTDGDWFGQDVAIDGDSVVVGARGDDVLSQSEGSAYIFARTGTTWSKQARLFAGKLKSKDYFGTSVAISGDLAVVGAVEEDRYGSAHLFSRTGTTWTQSGKLQASDAMDMDRFGAAVTMLGGRIAVGASPGGMYSRTYGTVYVFARAGSLWTEQKKITATVTTGALSFGRALATSGSSLLVGVEHDTGKATYSGTALVFELGTTWPDAGLPDSGGAAPDSITDGAPAPGPTALQNKLQATDPTDFAAFGQSTALEGKTAVVGSVATDLRRGAAYVFNRSGSIWSSATKLTAPDSKPKDEFGRAVVMRDGAVIVGAPYHSLGTLHWAGAAYMYSANGSNWSMTQKITASPTLKSTQLGAALAADGETLVAGAPGYEGAKTYQGAVYVFTRSGAAYSQQAMFTTTDSPGGHLGEAVAVSGDTLVAGSRGAVFVHVRSGTAWSLQQKLTGSGNNYGKTVAVHDDRVVVSVDSSTKKISGSWVKIPGTAYVYARSGTTWTLEASLQGSAPNGGARFGAVVGLDQHSLAVGAPGHGSGWPLEAGAVFVFHRKASGWQESQVLTASDGASFDQLGSSLALDGAYLLTGAPGDDDTKPGSGSAYVFKRGTVVGILGGKVTSPDGKAELKVPPGSVSGKTLFTITPAENPPAGALGTVYEIKPSGTKFSRGATLTMKYKDGDLDGVDEGDLTVGIVVDGKWQPLTVTSVDTAANTITAHLKHLSTYGVIPGVQSEAGEGCSCRMQPGSRSWGSAPLVLLGLLALLSRRRRRQ